MMLAEPKRFSHNGMSLPIVRDVIIPSGACLNITAYGRSSSPWVKRKLGAYPCCFTDREMKAVCVQI